MLEREAKQATTGIREDWSGDLERMELVSFGDSEEWFFFKALLSLLLSFFFRCACSQQKQMQLGTVKKNLEKVVEL